MAYSYDEMQGEAQPAHLGSQSDINSLIDNTIRTKKNAIENARDYEDLNPPRRAPIANPGSKIMDPSGMGRDVRID